MTPAAFRPDRPPEDLSGGTDYFGYGHYARALSTSVLDTEADFTFGLFGDWGLGKTTVLKALRRELDGNTRCALMMFDAWRYKDDPFRREFLREASTQLAAQGSLSGWDKAKELGAFDEDVATTADRGVRVSVPQLVRALSVILALAACLVLLGGVIADTPKGTTLGLVAVIPLVAFVLVRVERVLTVRQETATRRRLEDPDRFASVFRRLVGSCSKDVLVVSIDNLDRLPAEDAVEVLATIKTFLEPAAESARTPSFKAMLGKRDLPSTKVVFVVAVDDGALRRHLRAVAPVADPDSKEGRLYADEYLRKFFNASTTLRPLLAGDLAAYVQAQLEPVFTRAEALAPERRLLEDLALPSFDEQLRETAEMATVALRRNPRRVLQFVANLELQLRLIRERETATEAAPALITPAISGHIAMVAKLTLLEEEWPDAYSAIRADETLWESWHTAAQRGQLPREADADGPVADTWSEVAAFLRTSRRVRAESLRPFLRLKRALHELHVANYEEFRDRVVSANLTELDYTLDPREKEEMMREPDEARRRVVLTEEDRERAREYAALLPRIFAEEVEAGHVDAALNVVASTLAVDVLVQQRAVTTKLLSDALANALTAERLASLDPEQLGDAAEVLAPDDRAELLRRLAESLIAGWATREHHVGVVAVLKERAAELDEATRTVVQDAIARKDLVDDFWLYEPLAQADPALIPREAGQAALAWLGGVGKTVDTTALLLGDRERAHQSALRYQRDARERIRRGPQEAPFGVVLHVANSGAMKGQEPEIVSALESMRAVVEDSPQAVVSVAEYASDLRPALRDLDSADALYGLVKALSRGFSEMGDAVDLKKRLLQACGELLDITKTDVSARAEQIVQMTELGSSELADFVIARSRQVPGSLKPALVERLRRAREDLRRAAKWRDDWDSQHLVTGEEVESLGEGADIAAALASLDRHMLAQAAITDPEHLATALNDWFSADEARSDLLERLAQHAGGPGSDDIRGVSVARVEELSPEEPDAVDPADYIGLVVLAVDEAQWVEDPRHELLGEHNSYDVSCLLRLTLTLTRDESDPTVYVTVHDVDWESSGPVTTPTSAPP